MLRRLDALVELCSQHLPTLGFWKTSVTPVTKGPAQSSGPFRYPQCVHTHAHLHVHTYTNTHTHHHHHYHLKHERLFMTTQSLSKRLKLKMTGLLKRKEMWKIAKKNKQKKKITITQTTPSHFKPYFCNFHMHGSWLQWILNFWEKIASVLNVTYFFPVTDA